MKRKKFTDISMTLSHKIKWSLKTIRGKVTTMGVLAILASLVIGFIGIGSINRNAVSNEINSLIGQVSALQYKNQSLEALYQYYMDPSYLDTILSNLNSMQKNARKLNTIAGKTYQSQVKEILSDIRITKSNYKKLIEYHNSRGFTKSLGMYRQFCNANNAMAADVQKLLDGAEWVELKWNYTNSSTKITSPNITIDGKKYVHLKYKDTLPKVGKRNNLVLRLGGIFSYDRSYYITNVKLSNHKQTVDVNLYDQDVIPSGDAVVSAQLDNFHKEPAIKLKSNFDASGGKWQECNAQISIEKENIQDYDTLEYDLYLEPSDLEFDCQYGGAIVGIYDFVQMTRTVASQMHDYSMLVVEGKETRTIYQELLSLFRVLEESIPRYSNVKSAISASLTDLEEQKTLLHSMKTYDDEVFEIKHKNTTAFDSMTEICDQITSSTAKDMEQVRDSSIVSFMLILLLSASGLVLFTTVISGSIQKNMAAFHTSLNEITNGKISARVNVPSIDEFSEYGKNLNHFLDTFEGTIQRLQGISILLSSSVNRTIQKLDLDLDSELADNSQDHTEKGSSVNGYSESQEALKAEIRELQKLSENLQSALQFFQIED
ncbi:methyl-accepting chemotaxis protein [[Clostridium] polysaccharolyticum]|uniref:HAMP domain-containing protein n=1 Tax=[Clostridium] polysaccharolyticum TaxID=29364 RepID=A0A1H9ZTC5_9FIRM|nr:methyl-accepting chemotaxis protein [[Clostridium] polysaccharolyticum]SES84604.1 hypothetical protein SAMN04487772_10498 [[Clostridium] polysaccharolyticum]